MTTVVDSPDALKAKAGEHLGTSEWLEITQERVNTFADATDDHQWIHVDVERAKAGPFKGTIAHGYLTLSLVIPLWNQILEVRGKGMGINYGLNRVRFPAPVPIGSNVRLSATLAEVKDVAGNGIEIVVDMTVECDRAEKPACVAQAIYRFYP
ncbi:MaoC family dehydratase [Flindersiella endophytica]